RGQSRRRMFDHIGRREQFGSPRRLALLAKPLFFRIDAGRRQLSLSCEDRTAKVAWQRRPKLWNVLRQTGIIARQSGETVGGGLGVGVIELRREPGAPALLQGEKGQPEYSGDGNTRERDQHAAREPRHLRA